MKKIVLMIFIILAITTVFTKYNFVSNNLNKQYKIEIEKTIRNEIPKARVCVDKNSAKSKEFFIKSRKDKKDFEKYLFLAENYRREIEVCEMDLISKLLDITDKYKHTEALEPPTDFIGLLLDFLYPYFDEANIDYDDFKEFNSYTAKKIKELD